MPAQGQAQARIVGDDLLAFARAARAPAGAPAPAHRAARGAPRRQPPIAPGAGGRPATAARRPRRGSADPCGRASARHARDGAARRRCACPALPDRPLTMRSPSRSAPSFKRAIPVADLHVRRPHLDAVAARVLHQLRRRVEAHRLAVEQRRAERRRVVALDPGRDVDQQREARRVRFRKAVLAEAAGSAGRSRRRIPRV